MTEIKFDWNSKKNTLHRIENICVSFCNLMVLDVFIEVTGSQEGTKNDQICPKTNGKRRKWRYSGLELINSSGDKMVVFNSLVDDKNKIYAFIEMFYNAYLLSMSLVLIFLVPKSTRLIWDHNSYLNIIKCFCFCLNCNETIKVKVFNLIPL